jgi:hypothetical protein
LRIKILVMVSLAVCSLSVDAEAYTIKENMCTAQNGYCVVSCDLGTVVVGGGCYSGSRNVGFSVNYPSSDRQWACQPTSKPNYVIVRAICQ